MLFPICRIKIADRAVTDIISQTKGAQVAIEKATADYTNDYAFMHTDWQCPSTDIPYKVIFMFSGLTNMTNIQLVQLTGSALMAASYWCVCKHELLQSSDGGATWGTYDTSSYQSDRKTISYSGNDTVNYPAVQLNINMSVIPQPGVLYRMRTLYGKRHKNGAGTLSNGSHTTEVRFQLDNENTTHIAIPYWK